MQLWECRAFSHFRKYFLNFKGWVRLGQLFSPIFLTASQRTTQTKVLKKLFSTFVAFIAYIKVKTKRFRKSVKIRNFASTISFVEVHFSSVQFNYVVVLTVYQLK